MTAASIAQRAYAPTSASVRTERSIEFEVIARITHRLKRAILDDDFNALASALHENRRLWSILAADVASAENGLPEDLKARIFYLAEFTNQHTRQVLRGEANAASLVEINAAIIGGLQSEGAST